MRIVSPTGKKLKFNSRTVEYETPFLFLNNFDNISNGISISEIGPNIEFSNEIFNIESSEVFNTKNCLKMNSYNSNISRCNTVKSIEILENETYTFETYFSNYTGAYSYSSYTEVGFSPRLSFETNYSSNKYRMQIGYVSTGDYTLYNGASYIASDTGAYYFNIPVSLSTPLHFAAVIKNNYAYIFGNSVLYIKASIKRGNFNNTICFNRENYPVYVGINFISIRKGDFSNNLQSFTVPTKKYSL